MKIHAQLALVSSGLLAFAIPCDAIAQEYIFEQDPSSLPSVTVPRNPNLPVLAPNSTFQPTAPATSPLQSERYLVYVNASSPLMLEQIRRVEPEAFREQYQGRTVIQVGEFNEQRNAQQRAEALKQQGIRAEIAQVSGSGGSGGRSAKGYYVVIPAGADEIDAIQAQIARLASGIPTRIQERDNPRGLHIAVGPFESRGFANRWNRYLKDFGITNARVYYGP